jgi:uncharacterized membrane protein YidH (DUF202 family)
MKKLATFFALMLFFTLGISTTQTVLQPVPVYAADQQLDSVMDNINNSSSVLGDETKNKVAGISKDVLQIVLVIVTGVLMILGAFKAVQFANVGDNPSEKAKLKTTLIWLVLGIVFLASFFGMMRFGFKNFNLFSK